MRRRKTWNQTEKQQKKDAEEVKKDIRRRKFQEDKK